jgi:peptidoglycan/xylan/chitin deacetylase (PgdA/CDA1 family)
MVAFLEADCLARPGWVQRRIEHHRAGHAAVATAMSSLEEDGKAGKAALYLLHPNRIESHPPGPAHDYQAYGLSFTRELLERAGPFDEALRTDEDTAMVERVRSLGVQPWFDPAVGRVHIGPGTFAELMRDQYARGKLDSWRDVLRLPAGRHRQRWEAKRGARSAIVVARTFRRTTKRVRWVTAELRRGQAGPPSELLAILPYMALGQLAHQLGWCLDQLREIHAPNHDQLRGPLPAPTGVRRRVATNGERCVALTFDDGPCDQTRHVLEVLRRLDVPATFFVTGAKAQARPSDVQAMAADGHVVGGAGWRDVPFTDLSDNDLEGDISSANRLLEDLTGESVRLVRPPGGDYDRRVVTLLDRHGLQTWLWTTHPATYPDHAGREEIVAKTVHGLTPGSVLVLHHGNDVRDEAVAALPDVISTVRERGYEFVRLDPTTSDRP